MGTTFFVLMIIAMVLVLASLFAGLFVMARGGPLHQKYSNRLMQARVLMQAVALVLFALAIMTAS